MSRPPHGYADPQDELPPPSLWQGSFWPIAIGVVLLAILFARLLAQLTDPAPQQIEEVDAPKLVGDGWIGGEPPGDLAGKVIVLDAWAYWCGPCLGAAPELRRLAAEYQPKGVVFLGMTQEDSSSLAQSKAFIEKAKFDWPNLYGARRPFAELDIRAIPAMFVINKRNKVIWNTFTPEPIEAALERALAEEAPVARPAKRAPAESS